MASYIVTYDWKISNDKHLRFMITKLLILEIAEMFMHFKKNDTLEWNNTHLEDQKETNTLK